MWEAIEADFHREYGFDMSRPGALKSVSWRWFVTRLRRLSPDAAVRGLKPGTSATPENERDVTDALARAANRRKG